MVDEYQDTSRVLKSERIRAGLTVQELADYVGCSIGTVYNWESGRVEPGGKEIRKLSKAFGCTADYLVGISDDRTIIKM